MIIRILDATLVACVQQRTTYVYRDLAIPAITRTLTEGFTRCGHGLRREHIKEEGVRYYPEAVESHRKATGDAIVASQVRQARAYDKGRGMKF